MKWPDVPFEKLYREPSRNGVYKSKEHHGAGVKIVNMGELFSHDVINGQEMKRLRMSQSEMDKSGLEDGDLLFGRRSLVESGAGKCSLVEGLTEPTTFESSIIRVRVDPEQVRPRFIYYWLKSPQGSGRIRAIVTGTNVKGIRGSVLKTIDVACPATDQQDSVIQVIRAYDDLIENNTRRIKLLEDAARLLYEEWFVRLRFPGHEHTPINDGMPEGWERVLLSTLLKTQYGYTESAQAEIVGPKYLRGTDINKTSYIDWAAVPYCPIDESTQKKFALRVGDIVIIRMADPGKVAIVEQEIDAVFASYLIRLSPVDDRVLPYYLFYFLSGIEYQGFITGSSTGATRKSASAKLVTSYPILVPPLTLQRAFDEQVRPMRLMMTKLLAHRSKLREARDLLLPRLMSGEVAV